MHESLPLRLRRLSALIGGFAMLFPALALAAAKGGMPATGPNLAGNLLDMVLGLSVVVLMILAGAWFLRRFGRVQPGGPGVVRILGGMSLGPRERAVLVQVGETQLLLGVAPGRVQTLHVLDRPLPVGSDMKAGGGNFASPGTASAPAMGRGFTGRLAELLKQRGMS